MTDGAAPLDGAESVRPETVFTAILRRLVESTPGARAAVFADDEGEMIELHGPGDPIDLMLVAAHMGVLLGRLDTVHRRAGAGRPTELRLAASRAQYVTRPLGYGYQVTVVLEPVATIPKLVAALDEAMVQLRLQAGGVID